MQFIAHATEPKTFAHKKGATAAIKRDLNKHHDAHGDVVYDTGFDAKERSDGRWAVVLYVDLTPDEAQQVIAEELTGYVIEPQLKAAPKKVDDEPPADEPPADKPKRRKALPRPEGEYTEEYVTSRSRHINIQPSGLPLIPARHGSKQQLALEMLARDEGATLWELVSALVRNDGKLPKPETLTAGLYHHFPQKGYGISTTEDVNGVPHYHLVYPEGVDGVAPARRPESQATRLEAIRHACTQDPGRWARRVSAMNDDEVLEKFKSLTEFRHYLKEGDET